MAAINTIIGEGNYEKAKVQIASILALELANQVSLIDAALLIATDPIIIAFLEFNLSCIPSQVFVDRSTHPGPTEMPLLNVVFVEAPLDDLIVHSGQTGENTYTIESWQNSDTIGTVPGDMLAAKKCQRLLFMCQQIIMARDYINLGFEIPFIGWRKLTKIMVAQPEEGATNSHNSTFAKTNVIVKLHEEISDITGVQIVGTDANVDLNSTGDGISFSSTL